MPNDSFFPDALIELTGKKSRVGIDAFLQKSQGSLSFADLLQPYTPSGETMPPDALQKELEERVERVRQLLASTPISAYVEQFPDQDLFRVRLETEAGVPTLPASVHVRCWPITLRELDAIDFSVASSVFAQFSPLSFVALTSFFAFQAVAEEGSRQACARFVLNLPLVGAPENRRERILRTLLSNREQVVRFLMFLLAEFGGPGTPAGFAGGLLGDKQNFGSGWQGFALFESLLRALDRNPEKLDQVARLVEDLRGSEGSESLPPEGFEEVWRPIWEARQRAQQ